jgi:hypothetical protein
MPVDRGSREFSKSAVIPLAFAMGRDRRTGRGPVLAARIRSSDKQGIRFAKTKQLDPFPYPSLKIRAVGTGLTGEACINRGTPPLRPSKQ